MDPQLFCGYLFTNPKGLGWAERGAENGACSEGQKTAGKGEGAAVGGGETAQGECGED